MTTVNKRQNSVYHEDNNSGEWVKGGTSDAVLDTSTPNRKTLVFFRSISDSVHPASVRSITLNVLLKYPYPTAFTAEFGVGFTDKLEYPTEFEYASQTYDESSTVMLWEFPLRKPVPVNTDYYMAIELKNPDAVSSLAFEIQTTKITYDENYNPSQEGVSKTIKYYNGSSWVECEIYYHDGSIWKLVEPYYHSGGSWKEISAGG